MSGVGEYREQTQQRVRVTANWRLLERRLAIVRVRANQKIQDEMSDGSRQLHAIKT